MNSTWGTLLYPNMKLLGLILIQLRNQFWFLMQVSICIRPRGKERKCKYWLNDRETYNGPGMLRLSTRLNPYTSVEISIGLGHRYLCSCWAYNSLDELLNLKIVIFAIWFLLDWNQRHLSSELWAKCGWEEKLISICWLDEGETDEQRAVIWFSFDFLKY